jgi:hypothetical protein
MGDHAEFKDHIEMQEYAERSGLDYTWAGTNLFAKRARTLPPDQFEVRPVRTKRGITMVGLFSAAITRAERETDNTVSRGDGGEAAGSIISGRAADGASERGIVPTGVFTSLDSCRMAGPARMERLPPGRPPTAQGPRNFDTVLH